MKKTFLSFAILLACACAHAGPVAVVAVRPAPVAVRAPAPTPAVSRPAPAPAKTVVHDTAPHVAATPAVNPAILAASAAGGKKGCDDRAAVKVDCKR